jgi:hypothetical protein
MSDYTSPFYLSEHQRYFEDKSRFSFRGYLKYCGKISVLRGNCSDNAVLGRFKRTRCIKHS